MREMLFRGKRLDNGEWVYGSLLQVEHEDGSFTTAIFHKKDAGGDAEVFPATVGQYTGLKDKNGKRIFEGDIVVFSRGRNLPNNECLPELIKYHQGDCAYQRFPFGSWRYYTRGGSGLLIQPDMMVSCEVVGNVHDSPELLDASRCFECLNGAKNKSCTIYKDGYSCGYQQIMKWLQQPPKGE